MKKMLSAPTLLLIIGSLFLNGFLAVQPAHAQNQKMPREDVVEVPAIGDGLCVSNLFQTNMVLQRDKPINVWGWATAGETVTISFDGKTANATANAERLWEVTLEATPANRQPQSMTIKGATETLVLENLLVGDVWVLGGQSNMEFPISKVNDGQLEIVSANFPQIRLLTMPVGKGFDSVRSFDRLHEWSSWSGRHFRKGDWEICSPQTVTDFSAIGYVFGRRLAMAAQVPIGLIDTSIGGTTVETWTPEAVLREVEGVETKELLKTWDEKVAAYDPQADLKEQIARYESRLKQLKDKNEAIPADMAQPPSALRPGPAADNNRPGRLYAGVIQPLEGLSVAGALFHQGFNNAFSGSAGTRMYYQVFGKMITAWRKAFHNPEMPFCIISLCTAGEPQTFDNFLQPMMDVGVLVREAQYKTFRDFYDAGDQHIGYVSSFDQRKSWYHPQIKIPVGERAAKWALASEYKVFGDRGAENYWLPPSITESKIESGSIRLTFSTTLSTKDDSDGKMLGFAVAGKDRRFYPADINWYTDGSKDDRNRVIYSRNSLVLSSPFVSEPEHYRYAWGRNPMANITSPQAIPLAAQRSDDWLPEETPLIPNLADDPNRPANVTRGLLLKEIQFGEMQRKIQQAEKTLADLKPAYEKAIAEREKAVAPK